MISLQDRSLLVTYIQDYLKEYFGINLVRRTQRYTRATKDSYEISQNSPLRISGTYTEDTYTSAAIFMAFNYPNEQFPERWDLKSPESTEWTKTPFDQTKLVTTMNHLINESVVTQIGPEITEEIYNTYVPSTNEYLTWDEIIKYFNNGSSGLYDTLYSKEYSEDKNYSQLDLNSNLIVFLTHNLEVLPYQSRVVELNDRIISYFLDEVVTPSSSADEILRIQKLMYPDGISFDKAGKFFEKTVDSVGNTITNSMEQDVKLVQQTFIDNYSVSGQFTPPEGFSGFKVTGYVDPWTEWIIKGGLE